MSGERRSLIGRPDAACTYATADWLSAVDGEYKKADATVMSSIGLGGLGRQTDRPKLIEDYSKPEILDPSTFDILVFRHTRLFKFQFPSYICQNYRI